MEETLQGLPFLPRMKPKLFQHGHLALCLTRSPAPSLVSVHCINRAHGSHRAFALAVLFSQHALILNLYLAKLPFSSQLKRPLLGEVSPDYPPEHLTLLNKPELLCIGYPVLFYS